MTDPRNDEQHKKARENMHRVLATTNGGVWAVAGRTAYREEFQRNYGPDLDEWLDRTESGRES